MTTPTSPAIPLNPTLVLLPGLDGTGTLFAPFLEARGADIPTVVERYAREAAGASTAACYRPKRSTGS